MRKVLNPTVADYLQGDKGRALAAIVGPDTARLYLHGRQVLPWASLSFLIGIAFAMVTVFWHGLTAFWILMIWDACTLVPLMIYGIAVSSMVARRVAHQFGVPFRQCLDLPMRYPDRLREWLSAHATQNRAVIDG